MHSSKKIKTFILQNIAKHRKNIVQEVIGRFGISRQAVNKHMNRLISDNKVMAYGVTKGRYYELVPEVNYSKTINFDKKQDPELIFNKFIKPQIQILKNNLYDIFQFSICALLTNIQDYSNARTVYFKLFISHKKVHFIISDNGIGIFEDIKNKQNLYNERLAALELAKGSISSEPQNRSGEEVKLICNLFDTITIDSSGQSLSFNKKNEKWLINDSLQSKGTRIHLTIDTFRKRTCKEVFERYFSSENSKVRIPVNLADISQQNIVNSKSYVSYVLRNINNYNKVEFDFSQVNLIGPTFANELVRKTRESNLFAEIEWVNTNKTINLIMSNALASQASIA